MCINRLKWLMFCIFWFFKYMYLYCFCKFYFSLCFVYLWYNYSREVWIVWYWRFLKFVNFDFSMFLFGVFIKKKFYFRKIVIFLYFFIFVFSVKSWCEWFMNMGFFFMFLKMVIVLFVEMENKCWSFWMWMIKNVY